MKQIYWPLFLRLIQPLSHNYKFCTLKRTSIYSLLPIKSNVTFSPFNPIGLFINRLSNFSYFKFFQQHIMVFTVSCHCYSFFLGTSQNVGRAAQHSYTVRYPSDRKYSTAYPAGHCLPWRLSLSLSLQPRALWYQPRALRLPETMLCTGALTGFKRTWQKPKCLIHVLSCWTFPK